MGKFSVKAVVFCFIFSLILGSVSLVSQTKKAGKSKSPVDISKEVIATVGNEKITYGDLERAYRKNLNRKDAVLSKVPFDSVMDFLNLYVRYRLKVQDAISRGFDKDESVLQDLQQNKKILSESYYFDKKLTEVNVEKLLKLREWEMQIAIIMFAIQNFQNPDTVALYQRALKVMDSIKAGHNFATLAMNNSDDKESGALGGVIPTFITAGNVQRPIEKAIYSLEVGQVYPEIISTKYGYFIVKLLKKEPRVKVKASHILISERGKLDSASAYKKADSILNLLKAGKKFEILAEENSDDPRSAMNGGSLGAWYCRSSGMEGSGTQLVPEFVDALFNLKDGEISGLVHSDYGWHIIRRDSTLKINTEEEREEIKKLYKRLYLEQDKAHYMDSLKSAYGFSLNHDVFKRLLASVDTTKTSLDPNWIPNIPDEVKSQVLYKFMGNNVTVADFIKAVQAKNELRGFALTDEGFRRAINKLVEPVAFEEATKDMEKEYPDFAVLMNEFRDGILLFKVEAIEVWDKLKFDSTLAREYYDSTKYRYQTLPKYEISEIFVMDDSLAQSLYRRLKENPDRFDELAENYTQRAGYKEKKGYHGFLSEKESKLAQLVVEKGLKVGDISEPVSFERGYTIVKLKAIEPSRQKTFEEAISDFSPEVQEILQKNLTEKWLSEVKKKFPVKIERKKLESLLKTSK